MSWCYETMGGCLQMEELKPFFGGVHCESLYHGLKTRFCQCGSANLVTWAVLEVAQWPGPFWVVNMISTHIGEPWRNEHESKKNP